MKIVSKKHTVMQKSKRYTMILTKDKDMSSLNESKYFAVQCSG